MKISGLTIIRNGIDCGYTFLETIATLKSICDEVVVCEGYSTDNTYEYLEKIKDIKLFRDIWNINDCGVEFARITNIGLSRCTGDYILLLQADELLHEKDFDLIKSAVNEDKFNSFGFNFAHLRYSVRKKIKSNAYTEAIRIIKNGFGIVSVDDGYTFGGDVNPCRVLPVTIFHAGYVFLENILRKMINHANTFYVGSDNYKKRSLIASKLLKKLLSGDNVDIDFVHQELEPFYELIDHNLDLPKLLAPHEGSKVYVPDMNHLQNA